MDLIKKVNRESLYSDIVNILNGVLQLSNRESEVFSLLLKADSNGYESNINNKLIRLNIKDKLGISEPNLSRYLSTIKEKGLIVRGTNNKWVINDNIRPVIQMDEKTGKEYINIDFILNIINDKHDGEVKITGEYTQKSSR